MFSVKEFPVVKTKQKNPGKNSNGEVAQKINVSGFVIKECRCLGLFFFHADSLQQSPTAHYWSNSVYITLSVEKLVNRGESLGSLEKITITFSSCGA